MQVIYKYYEPDQGFEELQAKIYSEASGLPASVERIKARFQERETIFKEALYALTEEGEPLAYVQATASSSSPGRTHISFPWALPNCPDSVQETIFEELLTFLKQKEGVLEITVPLRKDSKNVESCVEFLQKRGFIDKEHLFYYSKEFTVSEVSNWSMNQQLGSLSSRKATLKDLDLICELCLSDPNYQFFTPEVAKNYFSPIIAERGYVVLVFDGKQLVTAGGVIHLKPGESVIKENKIGLISIRVSPTRPRFDYAWKRMVIEVAKEIINNGMKDLPLNVDFRFFASSTVAKNLAAFLPEISDMEYILSYRGNSNQ